MTGRIARGTLDLSSRSRRRFTAFVTALALVIACLGFVPWLAFAEDETLPSYAYGQLSYNASDGYWHRDSDNVCVFKQVDGKAYPCSANGAVTSTGDEITTRLYPDGQLVFRAGDWERPEDLASGRHCLMADTGVTWFRQSATTMERFAHVVTSVRFDESLLRDDIDTLLDTSLSNLLGGLSSIERIEGTENLAMLKISRAAGLFKGCAHLREVDLSPLDFSVCSDAFELFDGCTRLERVSIGSKWISQSVQTGRYAAVFPHEMACISGGKRIVYAAGSAIPAGIREYITTQTSIEAAKVVLLQSDSYAVSAEDLIALGWDGLGLPEGISPGNVTVCSSTTELESSRITSLEYTGDALSPCVVVEVDGTLLHPGTDFTLAFTNNTGPGTALITIEGTGAYRGVVTTSFEIVGSGAYALLYENGTLVLQAGRAPVEGIAGPGSGAPDVMPWFTAETASSAAQPAVWDKYRNAVKRVVIDKSFSRYRLTSTSSWFEACSQLEEIVGLENLDTSRLKDMSHMFAGCTSLEELDLSALASTARVEHMAGVFDGCSKLVSLITGPDWQNVRSATECATLPSAMLDTANNYRRIETGAALPHGACSFKRGGIPLQLVTVMLDKPNFACTGSPIEPAMKLTLGATTLVKDRDYSVTYADNIMPGAAHATIRGMGAFTGGLIVPFAITSAVTHVGDKLVYRTTDAIYTLKVTKVKRTPQGTVAAEVSIISVVVTNFKAGILVFPDTCTVGGNTVDVTAVGSKLGGAFRKVSCVVIGAKVTVIAPKAFAKSPKVKKLKLKTKRLKKATNSLKGSKVKSVQAICKLTAKKRKAYKKMFQTKAGKPGVKFSCKK